MCRSPSTTLSMLDGAGVPLVVERLDGDLAIDPAIVAVIVWIKSSHASVFCCDLNCVVWCNQT